MDVGVCFDSESALINSLKVLKMTNIIKWRENIEKIKMELSWEVESLKLISCYNKL